MSAKESAEMRHALALVDEGKSIQVAAKIAQVHWASLYRKIKARKPLLRRKTTARK